MWDQLVVVFETIAWAMFIGTGIGACYVIGQVVDAAIDATGGADNERD